jgi:hypothetical protein
MIRLMAAFFPSLKLILGLLNPMQIRIRNTGYSTDNSTGTPTAKQPMVIFSVEIFIS